MATVEMHQQNEIILEEKLENVQAIADSLREKNRKL